jgi:NADH:ubiquinone oxidoreductase subunit F (NADH-binding)
MATRAPAIARVLDAERVATLDSYCRSGGGRALDAARRLGAAAVVEHVAAAGLRGRGGAGFPTAKKWQAVASGASDAFAATVVVNAAEGEPGTFKDRAIVRANPFRLLEGALIAAAAVGADRVIVALKASFAVEVERLRAAIDEVRAAGWADGVELTVHEGPGEYLFGEETALLEVLDGRPPFPRIAPPFRHGVDEVGDGSASSAGVELADGPATVAPPTLVNNVETLANVPGILANGPDWFREVGTEESPGTVVCTVSGATVRSGVGEVAMGTPLRAVIEQIGGGMTPGRRVTAVLSGVANPLLPGDLLDTPVSYEGMTAAGAGLGAAGFFVFDDRTDLAAVVAGVSRFLAVESCGQCEPCKNDGLAIADLLERLCGADLDDAGRLELDDRVRTVADNARCFLAQQHQHVVGSLLTSFPEQVEIHRRPGAEPVPVELVAPIVDVVAAATGDSTRFAIDETQGTKQPDWTHDDPWSGKPPSDRL